MRLAWVCKALKGVTNFLWLLWSQKVRVQIIDTHRHEYSLIDTDKSILWYELNHKSVLKKYSNEGGIQQ